MPARRVRTDGIGRWANPDSRDRVTAGSSLAVGLLVLAVGFAGASPAEAGEPAAVVAEGPGGVTLQVRDEGRRLRARLSTDEEDGCSPPPRRAARPQLLSTSGAPPGSDETSVLGGVVTANVAAVELQYRGERHPRRVETVAGDAYRGRHAGCLRFFLAERPEARYEPYYVRLLGVDGAVTSCARHLRAS